MKYKKIKKMLFAEMKKVVDDAMMYEFMSDDTQYLAKQIHDISQLVGQNAAGFPVIQTLIKKYSECMNAMDFGIAISYLLDIVNALNPGDPMWSEDYEVYVREKMLEAVHILMRDAAKKLKKSPLKDDFIGDLYYALALDELGESDAYVLNIDTDAGEVPCVCHMSDEEIDDYIEQFEEEEAEYEEGINALDEEEQEDELIEENYARQVEDEIDKRDAVYDFQTYDFGRSGRRYALVNEWLYW